VANRRAWVGLHVGLLRELGGLGDEGLVDVGDHTSSSNGGLDQGIELLVSANSELQMAGGDALHLQILGGVAGQLKHLGGQVLEDGGAVDGGGGSNATTVEGLLLQDAVHTTNRELEGKEENIS